MKNNVKLLIVLFLIGLVTSCKSDKKTNSESEITTTESEPIKDVNDKKKVDNDNFTVRLDIVSSEEGLFQVLYNQEEPSDQWQKKYFQIKKSKEIQTIEAKFDLNEFGHPKQLRLILGGETPKQIILKDFTLSSDGNIIKINGDNFEKFMIKNQFIKLNKENNTLNTIKVNDRHVPIMVLTKRALDSLSY